MSVGEEVAMLEREIRRIHQSHVDEAARKQEEILVLQHAVTDANHRTAFVQTQLAELARSVKALCDKVPPYAVAQPPHLLGLGVKVPLDWSAEHEALTAKLATLDGAAGGEASDKTSAREHARADAALMASSPGDAPKTGALFGGEASADEKGGGG